MKNKALFIGLGVAAVAVIGFLFLRKKNTDGGEEKSATATGDVTDADIAAVEAEVMDAQAAEDELAKLEQEPPTIENERKKKKLREKLARFGAKVRENTKVGRVFRDVGQKVGSNLKEVGQAIAKRRQCSKEADDKFGFPLKPKKIKEKREFKEKCRNEGGESFAFSHGEETYDIFG